MRKKHSSNSLQEKRAAEQSDVEQQMRDILALEDSGNLDQAAAFFEEVITRGGAGKGIACSRRFQFYENKIKQGDDQIIHLRLAAMCAFVGAVIEKKFYEARKKPDALKIAFILFGNAAHYFERAGDPLRAGLILSENSDFLKENINNCIDCTKTSSPETENGVTEQVDDIGEISAMNYKNFRPGPKMLSLFKKIAENVDQYDDTRLKTVEAELRKASENGNRPTRREYRRLADHCKARLEQMQVEAQRYQL